MSHLLGMAAAQLRSSNAHSNRVACWLARAAAEEAIDALLIDKGVDARAASGRSKLSSLAAVYGESSDIPHQAHYVWTRLSEACHQHAYRLSPIYAEVAHLINLVGRLASVGTGEGEP